ncbi:hypothetical protein [Chitinimonas lacunae]|uniref:Metallothionein n=1 Tax=Chitinimonas lacunae TaxID=1963018 RepID=A0ABV8MMY4_9NEIS
MDRCEKCGNSYKKCFAVEIDGQRHLFDSFECAISALAPTCAHCQCRIIGHGVEGPDGNDYCCEHCAKGMQQGLGNTQQQQVQAH